MNPESSNHSYRKDKSIEEEDNLQRSTKKIKSGEEGFEGGTSGLRRYDDLVQGHALPSMIILDHVPVKILCWGEGMRLKMETIARR